MASTYERSLLKGIVWEGISFIITTLAVFIFYGNWKTSIKFSFIFALIKIVLFFFHERLWKNIGWGKV